MGSGSNALVFEGTNIVTTGAPSITTIDALDSAIVKGERLKADNAALRGRVVQLEGENRRLSDKVRVAADRLAGLLDKLPEA